MDEAPVRQHVEAMGRFDDVGEAVGDLAPTVREVHADEALETIGHHQALPTLADAAERALVSRATAYRYFSSQEALLEELQLDLDVPDEDLLFGSEAPPASAEDRVSLVRRELYDFVMRNELQYRVFLRNWLDHWLKRPADDEPETRGARRERLLDRALEPFEGRLDPGAFARLKIALGVMVGVESMIVLKDVYGLEREQVEETMDWAVRALVTAALDKGAPDEHLASTEKGAGG